MRVAIGTAILGLLLLYGCGGPSDSIGLISYPRNSFSGRNILHESLSELVSTKNYSMIAQIERGQIFRVVLTNESDSLPTRMNDLNAYRWLVDESLNTGWFIEDYDISTHSQTFYAEGPSSPHLRIDFLGCGRMLVEIYEIDGGNVTTTKTIDWSSFCDN